MIADEVRAAHAWARQVGVHVVNLDNGATVYAEDATAPRILASNTKLVTTAAALDALGSGHQFETRVAISGRLEASVLAGDLAVIGQGDPAISGRFHDGDPYAIFNRWADELLERGVRRVAGRLLLVDGYFDDQAVHPDWPRDQLTRWYEAPVGGLSFSDNCLLVRVYPGAKAGELARVETVPSLPDYAVRVTARTTTSRRRGLIHISRALDGDAITVSGAVYHRSGPYEAWIAVRSPHEYFGRALRDALERRGIAVDGATERLPRLPEGAWETVAAWRTPIQDVVSTTNKRSQNLFAESLCKLLGRVVLGEGSWKSGVEAVSAFLARAGLAPGSYEIVDGSGLSRRNRMSAEQMTRLLAYMYRHPQSAPYLASLAYSGEQGLKWEHRLASLPYRGNVFAKTGTLNDVSTLSGYAKGRSGAVYAFAILFNGTKSNWRLERVQDAIVRAVVDRG
jgi:D-alanyl-D-alanine carboxypeptidase/D-alanyl-D-alanine-endopeptidase (penicillin-binding protein 4)